MTDSKRETPPGAAVQTPLRITQVRSAIGRPIAHKRTLTALGLRRLHQTVEHTDTPVIRGMVARVGYLVRVEQAGDVRQEG